MPSSQVIYCIGDSHASFFSGDDQMQPEWPRLSYNHLPCFRAYRLGPVLAYNLNRIRRRAHGREKLLAVLHADVPIGSKVMLCFGEIDCRVHLLKQSHLNHRSEESVVQECIANYQSVIMEVAQRGYQVLVWNVVPPTKFADYGSYPSYGGYEERTQITRSFNAHLAQACFATKIAFVSIYDQLLDELGHPLVKYYKDSIHLSQNAMPLVITALRQINSDYELLCSPLPTDVGAKQSIVKDRFILTKRYFIFALMCAFLTFSSCKSAISNSIFNVEV